MCVPPLRGTLPCLCLSRLGKGLSEPQLGSDDGDRSRDTDMCPCSTTGGPGHLLLTLLLDQPSAQHQGPRGSAGSRTAKHIGEETCAWRCCGSMCWAASVHPSICSAVSEVSQPVSTLVTQ